MSKPDRLQFRCALASGRVGEEVMFMQELAPMWDEWLQVMVVDAGQRQVGYLTKDQARELFSWLGAKLHG